MKLQKLLFSVLTFMLMLGTTVSAATSSTMTITPRVASGSTVNSTDRIFFDIVSTKYGITEITSKERYKATGLVVDEDVITAGNGTNYAFYVTAPIANGTYMINVTAKDSNGDTVSKEIECTITGHSYKTEITADVPSGSTIDSTKRVVINATTNEKYASLYSVSYKITSPSLSSAVTETYKCKSLYDLDYTMPALTKAGTYEILITALDGNGTTTTKTFTYTVPGNTVDNKITLKVAPNNGSTFKASQLVMVNATTTAASLKSISCILKNSANEVVANEPVEVTNVMSANAKITIPGKTDTYKLYVTAKDVNGKSESATYTFYMNTGSNDDTTTNNITFTASPTSGNTVKPGSTVVARVYSSLTNVNIKSFSYVLKNAAGVAVSSNSTTSSTSTATLNVGMKDVTGVYTLLLTATDAKGLTKSTTYTYVVSTSDVQTAEITITPSVSSGSTISPEREIKFTAKSNNSSVGITEIKATVDGNTESNKSSGETTLDVTVEMPEDEGTYTVTVTAKNQNGTTKTETFKYTVDEDSEDDPKKGVINDDAEDLVIDLWTTSDSRFYELDEEIGFVAYYYNADSKTKKDVVIEVEVPDGFKVVSKSTAVGSASYSSDTLKFKLGSVAKKELGEVRFVLKPEDDDVCGEITEIVATIESDDDEEDSSTQLIWVYESGDKGKFNAYVTGYTDGTFRPDNGITREEVATMMSRAFGHKVYTTTRKFSDIATTRWSYNYIMGCVNKNIIVGYTDGTFRPNNNITRAELYTMIYKALSIDSDEKPLYVPKEYKKDDSWEKNYVAGLTRLRMFEDMDDTDADEIATRAEVVYLINRVQFRNPSNKTSSTYSDVYSHWAAKDIESASVTYSYKRTASGKENIQ